jgi:hypothetical protein
MRRLLYSLIAGLLVPLAAASCMLPHRPGAVPVSGNPIFVPNPNIEAVWERTVDVLHDYQFEVVRENRLGGVIETDYKVGSGFLEPWHHESVGHFNRLESTLQSIRRRVVVNIRSEPQQAGYLVSVEAYKELEDLPGLAANSAGGATFQENAPLQRDLNLAVGQSTPSGWIPMGRDLPLEQALLGNLMAAYTY